MNSTTLRTAGSAIFVAIIPLVLAFTHAAPAGAEEPAQDCVLYVDEDLLVCVPTGDDLDAAFFAETGLVRVPSGSDSGAERRGPAVIYDLVTYHAGNAYTGANFTVTRSSSCNGSTTSGVPDLAVPGLDNAISSFQTYGTCVTRLYADTIYGGSTYGYSSSVASLPSFNDIASSTRVH